MMSCLILVPLLNFKDKVYDVQWLNYEDNAKCNYQIVSRVFLYIQGEEMSCMLCLSVSLSVFLFGYLFDCLPVWKFLHFFVRLFACLFVCLYVRLFAFYYFTCLFLYLVVCLSTYLYTNHIKQVKPIIVWKPT